jgi:predicted Zn-dependent protease with MMP-like domain
MTDPARPATSADEAIDAVFDAAIERAIGRLPEPFAERLATVAIVIDDEPTQAQLASVGAAGLYGLYQGVPRTSFGADAAPVPSKITIFRGPLVRAHRDSRSLGQAVEETVLHEIAHHFGLSDARLAELDRTGH